MSGLKKTRKKIEEWRPRTTRLLKIRHVKVDDVDIGQIIGGARDIKSLIQIFLTLIRFDRNSFQRTYNSLK